MRRFRPSPTHTNLLVLLGCLAFVCGLYLRLRVIDAQALEAACAAEGRRAVCLLQRTALEFRDLELFGGVALIAAIAHFVRPTLAFFGLGVVAAILGLLLHNAGPSALAAALLILSFARPAPASKPTPAATAPPPATAPASSKPSR